MLWRMEHFCEPPEPRAYACHKFINSEILYLVIRIFEILGDMAAKQALNNGNYNSTILISFLSDEGVITAIAPF